MEQNSKAPHPAPKRRPATGHEIPLSSMIANGYKIEITLLNSEKVYGYVRSFDKYTITIDRLFDKYSEPVDSCPTTFFKHGILSFTRAD